MTRNELVESAGKLKAPTPEAREEYTHKRDAMAAEAVELFLARPDAERLVGADNRDMAANNSHNFPRFMESLFTQYQPEVLVDTATWAIRTYRAHGFSAAYWPAHLDVWLEILNKNLSEKAQSEIMPHFQWILVNLPALMELSEG